VEENETRFVRYNEVVLLNGRFDHSQNSLKVKKYSVTEQQQQQTGGGKYKFD
jgi:hypothetical protein